MIIRLLNEIAANFLAVMVLITTIFVACKISRTFRRYILPIGSASIAVLYFTIYLSKCSIIQVSNGVYYAFYSILSTMLFFVKYLNVLLEGCLSTGFAVSSVFKVLLISNIHETIASILLLSKDLITCDIIDYISFEKPDLLSWLFKFDSNKKLHTTFKEQRVVLNC